MKFDIVLSAVGLLLFAVCYHKCSKVYGKNFLFAKRGK